MRRKFRAYSRRPGSFPMSTRTDVVESVLAALSSSIVPERFGGDAMIIVVIALLVAAWSLIGSMRWRAAQELRFPGLEEVHAWGRLGSAPVYTTTSDGLEEVRIIPRGTARPEVPRAAEPDAPAEPSGAATRTRDRIIIDDLATVHEFTELRDDLHRRLGRTQRRIAICGLSVAATVTLLVILL